MLHTSFLLQKLIKYSTKRTCLQTIWKLIQLFLRSNKFSSLSEFALFFSLVLHFVIVVFSHLLAYLHLIMRFYVHSSEEPIFEKENTLAFDMIDASI